jgi:hypothetical protein
MHIKFQVQKPKRRLILGDENDVVGGRAMDSVGSGYGPVVGCCKCGNEHSGSIKDEG